jgi:hypothetical protein
MLSYQIAAFVPTADSLGLYRCSPLSMTKYVLTDNKRSCVQLSAFLGATYELKPHIVGDGREPKQI